MAELQDDAFTPTPKINTSSDEEDPIEVQKRNGRILRQVDNQILLNKKNSVKKHWTACFGDRIYKKL